MLSVNSKINCPEVPHLVPFKFKGKLLGAPFFLTSSVCIFTAILFFFATGLCALIQSLLWKAERNPIIPRLAEKAHRGRRGENQINNWGRDFSTSVRPPIHNTSCHTRKCDTSNVINTASASSPDVRNIALILSDWASAISSQVFTTVRNWRKSNIIPISFLGKSSPPFFPTYGLSTDFQRHKGPWQIKINTPE